MGEISHSSWKKSTTNPFNIHNNNGMQKRRYATFKGTTMEGDKQRKYCITFCECGNENCGLQICN